MNEPVYGGGVVCTGRFIAGSALAVALALAACTPAPEQPQQPEQRPVAPVVLTGWETVDLPGELIPATVASM
ncbi:MAG: hypothetical protein ABWX96_08340, partial [Propionibacteriaceae bacterium]